MAIECSLGGIVFDHRREELHQDRFTTMIFFTLKK
jgi:hypothetical protein